MTATDAKTELDKAYPGPWGAEIDNGAIRVTSSALWGYRRLVCVVPGIDDCHRSAARAAQALPGIVTAANALLDYMADQGRYGPELDELAAALKDAGVRPAGGD